MTKQLQVFFIGLLLVVVGIVIVSWLTVTGIVLMVLGVFAAGEAYWIPARRRLSWKQAFNYMLAGFVIGLIIDAVIWIV